MTKEKETETRILNISNFRNLGAYATENQKNDRAFLKLNRSLERNELGNLVLVMGLNNSGKSNVLCALEKYHGNNFDDDDIPDFIVANVNPNVCMNVANGAYQNKNAMTAGQFIEETFTSPQSSEIYTNLEEKLFQLEYFEQYQKVPVDALYDQMRSIAAADLDVDSAKSAIRPFALTASQILKKIPEFAKDYGTLANAITTEMESDTIDSIRLQKLFTYTVGEFVFYEKYGYNLSERVLRYSQTRIRHEDLVCDVNYPNDFFTTLLDIMGVNVNDFGRIYKNALYTKGSRKKFETSCNEKLAELSDDFNKMFTSDPDNEYKFEVSFETEKMFFTIDRGDISLGNLDRQSDGFRWTFDFFMNFIKKQSFLPGDIILMDEFGYNLNPKSVKELSIILRKFAQAEGLTIVVATQNFMIVDTHHLDEVRLVVNEPNGNTIIINQFDQFDKENHDVLRPLLESLTVGRNFLRNEGRETIFVEGSSDYFFLTSFADKMRKDGRDIDIDFLPINGLGGSNGQIERTVRTLLSVDAHPIVLVDNDGAGQQFEKEANRRKITALTLSKVMENEELKEIEHLFSDSDCKKFHVDAKSFDRNACFAQQFEKYYGDLAPLTVTNFEKLIEQLVLR
jgi:energy-coupling factor transporter ATP-binding protein EcfA2